VIQQANQDSEVEVRSLQEIVEESETEKNEMSLEDVLTFTLFRCNEKLCKAICKKKGKNGKCVKNKCVCKKKSLQELVEDMSSEEDETDQQFKCNEKRCKASAGR